MSFETINAKKEGAVLFVEIAAGLMNLLGPELVRDLRDSDLFCGGMRDPESQSRIQDALKRGFQTRDAELTLAGLLGDLS